MLLLSKDNVLYPKNQEKSFSILKGLVFAQNPWLFFQFDRPPFCLLFLPVTSKKGMSAAMLWRHCAQASRWFSLKSSVTVRSTPLSSSLIHISLWQNLNHILSNQCEKVQDPRKRKQPKGKTKEGEIRLGAAVIFAWIGRPGQQEKECICSHEMEELWTKSQVNWLYSKGNKNNLITTRFCWLLLFCLSFRFNLRNFNFNTALNY